MRKCIGFVPPKVNPMPDDEIEKLKKQVQEIHDALVGNMNTPGYLTRNDKRATAIEGRLADLEQSRSWLRKILAAIGTSIAALGAKAVWDLITGSR